MEGEDIHKWFNENNHKRAAAFENGGLEDWRGSVDDDR